MDTVDSIAAFSTAMSQAKLQSAVSVRVFKLAQGQAQVAADLLTEAFDNVAASMKSFAADAGANIDDYA